MTTWSGFALEGGPPSSFTEPAALQGSDALRYLQRKTRTCHFSHDPKEKGFQLSDSRLDMDADQRVQKGYESCTIFGVWCEQSCRK